MTIKIFMIRMVNVYILYLFYKDRINYYRYLERKLNEYEPTIGLSERYCRPIYGISYYSYRYLPNISNFRYKYFPAINYISECKSIEKMSDYVIQE
jgi:hypothetical protein